MNTVVRIQCPVDGGPHLWEPNSVPCASDRHCRLTEQSHKTGICSPVDTQVGFCGLVSGSKPLALLSSRDAVTGASRSQSRL